MKRLKKQLLTDFSIERWNGIDLESVGKALEKLEKTVFGRFGNHHPNEMKTFFNVEQNGVSILNLKEIAHKTTNIYLDGCKIYGDVEFLDNINGNLAYELFESGSIKFGICAIGIQNQLEHSKLSLNFEIIKTEIIIKKIIAFDIIQKFDF